MKIYNQSENSWPEYLDNFNTWLNERVDTVLPVIHKIHKAGHITYMKAADKDVYLTIDFPESSKQYSLAFLIEHQHLMLNETVASVLYEIYEQYTASRAVREHQLKAEAAAQREQQAAAKESARKEAADKARREKAIARAQTIRPEAICSEPRTYYEVLGWMAGNVKSIRATVPSDLEAWFLKNFGAVEHTVVDSSKKTVNGNPMKWSISFKATFKNELPAALSDKTGASKKTIDSVSYIWDLIENYGFCFGTEQNFDKIKRCIPDSFMYEFEKGLVNCGA